MWRLHLSFSEKQHSGSARMQNTAYDVEVLRCSLAPHMAELLVLILTILLILTLLMQSCWCSSLSPEHRRVSAWVDFFSAFHKMFKLVLLCLGLKTKPEETDSTFLLFFFPLFLAVGLVTTQMSTQHSWIGKALWSTSSRIQTVQGYLQMSFKRVREWRPPHWRKRLTKSLHRMNNLCFGAWDGPAAAQEHQQREWASKAAAAGGHHRNPLRIRVLAP